MATVGFKGLKTNCCQSRSYRPIAYAVNNEGVL